MGSFLTVLVARVRGQGGPGRGSLYLVSNGAPDLPVGLEKWGHLCGPPPGEVVIPRAGVHLPVASLGPRV